MVADFTAAQHVSAIARICDRLDQRHELGRWADQATELEDAGATIFGVAAKFAAISGDYPRAVARAEAGIARAADATKAEARLCWEARGRGLWFSGRVTDAWSTLQRWALMSDPDDEPFDAAWACVTLVGFAQLCEPAMVAELVARARRITADLRNPCLIGMVAWASGIAEVLQGRFDEAIAHYREAVRLASSVGDRYFEGFALSAIAMVTVRVRDDDAADALRQAISALYEARTWMLLYGILITAAVHLAWNGANEPAAVLFGWLDARDLHPPDPAFAKGALTRTRQEFIVDLENNPQGSAWLAEGAQLDADAIVQYALRTLT